MNHQWSRKPRLLFLTSLVLALVFVVACASTAAPEQVVVEKEVIKEVPLEKIVEKEIVVTKEVIKEVAAEVKVLPTVETIVQALPTAPPVDMMAKEGIQGGRIPQLDYADVRQRTLMASSINNKNVAMIFNGLVEYNPETEDQTDLRCDLCTSWELAEDGVTYTFPPASRRHVLGWPIRLPPRTSPIASWHPPARSAYLYETAKRCHRQSRSRRISTIPRLSTTTRFRSRR